MSNLPGAIWVFRERDLTEGSKIPTAATLFMNRERLAEISVTHRMVILSEFLPNWKRILLIHAEIPVRCNPSEIMNIPINVITGELLKPEKISSGFTNPTKPRITITTIAKRSGRNLSLMMRTAKIIVMIKVIRAWVFIVNDYI
jgi:hypothetical protein